MVLFFIILIITAWQFMLKTLNSFKYFCLLFVFIACQVPQYNKDITFNGDFDTLTVTNRYASNKIKEIIYYKDNKPTTNIGFLENGDTIKNQRLVFDRIDSSLFIYIPVGTKILDTEIFIGIDSSLAAQGYKPIISTLTKNNSKKIRKSSDLNLKYELIRNNDLKGVLKCMFSDSINKYYPFETE